jgi:hypothetical protein
MRQAHISDSGVALTYQQAAALAAKLAADDRDVIEPVLVAWYDRKGARMSPAIEGADLRSRWHDYGASHGGQLEIDVGGNYAFIYADSSAFDPYEPSPYSNLRDKDGNEYICQINLLGDPRKPTPEACTPLDDWTSKLT